MRTQGAAPDREPGVDYAGLLTSKIQSRAARVSVVGMGYVGLPMSVLCAEAGFKVTGIERNPERVNAVNDSTSYIAEVTDERLRAVVSSGGLSATSDFDSIRDTDIIVIAVPTPLDDHKTPDLGYIHHVLDESESRWHAGQMLILESTTYPGTTEEEICPRIESRGFVVGEEVFVAYSPERMDPGNTSVDIRDVPKIVGGVTPQCTSVSSMFYRQVYRADVVTVSSPKIGEMAKLFENVFRVVNVSLVNELAQLSERMGIDFWEVIDAAKTKPYGFMAFSPGPGVGGHCIPIDPVYLSWRAEHYNFSTRLIDLAGEINDEMPIYVAHEISSLLNRVGKPLKGSKVLIMGVAFKRDVADTRESAALKLAEILVEDAADVSFHDPYVDQVTIAEGTYESVPLSSETVGQQDLVVITTDHSNVDYQQIVDSAQLVYDCRNALGKLASDRPNVFRLGAPKRAWQRHSTAQSAPT